jgi:hypothetical protein
MKRLFVAFLLVIAVFLLGCATQQVPADKPAKTSVPAAIDSCKLDSDCVCGGIDRTTGMCFMGNKEYYDKNVDKSKQCPDFCTGIAGNLVVRCIDNKCIQMFECLTDADCESGSCRGNRCS